MRAFRYRLAAVLARAEHQEQALQIELGRLERELEKAAARTAGAARAEAALQERLRRAHRADLELARLDSIRRDLEGAARARQWAEGHQEALHREVATARSRLLEAAQRRRGLERHRGRLALRDHRAGLAAEIKRLDDLATIRHARGPAEGAL